MTALPKVHEFGGRCLAAEIKARMEASGFAVVPDIEWGGRVNGLVNHSEWCMGYAVNISTVPVFGVRVYGQPDCGRHVGYAPRGTVWIGDEPDPTKMVFHVSIYGRAAGVTFVDRGAGEWAPNNVRPAVRKLTAFFRSLGFTIIGVHMAGYFPTAGRDELHCWVVTNRPDELF